MGRFYFLFIFFITFFTGSWVYGAGPAESEKLIIVRQDSLLENQILYNGRVWRDLYSKVEDDQFFLSGMYMPGSLAISGRTFDDINIKYDIYNDEIIIPTDHGLMLQLNKERVDSFSLVFLNKSYHFIKIQEDSVKGFNGYLNLLYRGKVLLYVKYKKDISLLAVDGKFDKFYQNHRIYIVKDNQVIPVNRRGELYKILGDFKSQLRSYIKANRLKVSIKNPESFVPVIKYYDSLSQ